MPQAQSGEQSQALKPFPPPPPATTTALPYPEQGALPSVWDLWSWVWRNLENPRG